MNIYIPSTEYKESTKFNWNVQKVACAVFNTIPYILCTYNHLLSNSGFFSSWPFKNIFHNLLTTILFQSFVACQNEFCQSLSFHSFPFLFFLSLNSSSLLPFLCSLSFSFHSQNRAGSCSTVCLSSTPHQLFSPSLPLFYLLLSIVSCSYSTRLTWQFRLIPLHQTQENMSSPAINAKYSKSRRQPCSVTQIRVLLKV